MADMWDQLIFIGGFYEWTSIAASTAMRMKELRPGFRKPFGSSCSGQSCLPRPTIRVTTLRQASSCLTQHDATAEKLAGGPLRAAVWAEDTPGNASARCLHIVVVNTAVTATYAFSAVIQGAALTGPMVATRMYEPGPSLNVSAADAFSSVLDPDYIAPGEPFPKPFEQHQGV